MNANLFVTPSQDSHLGQLIMGEQARAEARICCVDMPDVAPKLVSEQEMLVSFAIQQCPHKALAHSLAAF